MGNIAGQEVRGGADSLKKAKMEAWQKGTTRGTKDNGGAGAEGLTGQGGNMGLSDQGIARRSAS